MGKVDHAQDAVYHGVPQRDQRIDTTLGNTEDHEVEPDFPRISTRVKCAERPDDHGSEDGHAEGPQENVDDGQPLEPVPLDACGHKRCRHWTSSFCSPTHPARGGRGCNSRHHEQGDEPEATPQLIPQTSPEGPGPTGKSSWAPPPDSTSPDPRSC